VRGPLASRLDQSVPDGIASELGTISEPQLRQQALAVPVDRVGIGGSISVVREPNRTLAVVRLPLTPPAPVVEEAPQPVGVEL
jgi:hypothetical protein